MKARVIAEGVIFVLFIVGGLVLLKSPKFPLDRTTWWIVFCAFVAVFLVEVCFISPYNHAKLLVEKHNQEISSVKLKSENRQKEIGELLNLKQQRRDENAKNVLGKASALLKEAKYPTSFQALHTAGAAELETNEQLVWICGKLTEHHTHPFEGIDDCVLKEEWLEFLQWGKYHARFKFDTLDYVDGADVWASDRKRNAHPRLGLAVKSEMRRP